MKPKKIVYYLLLCSLFVITLSGCSMNQEDDKLETTGFAFDTTYTITLYQGGTKKLLNSCISKCTEYEAVFSRTMESSELYQVNELEQIYKNVIREDEVLTKQWDNSKVAYNQDQVKKITNEMEGKKSDKNKLKYHILQNGKINIEISDLLSDIIQAGIAYSEKSSGSFDIAIEPVTTLWDFTGENPVVPESKKIEEALDYVDYRMISIKDHTLSFAKPGMGIDLGGIAKGFIADDLKAYLKKNGVKSAVINLGGNILCVGKKSAKENFSIGVQQPFANRNETVAAVSVDDMSVVSSGIYERYFKKDGKLYHHILDPTTGYSFQNDLIAVTILSEKSVDGDGLSTTCFSLGKEKGISYINSLKGVEAMFITQDEKITYSDGFKHYLIEE